MDTEVKHVRVVVENLLRAVAVMHIPVDDQHLRKFVLLLDVAGGDGHIVQQAEPHGPVARGVMAGRADGTKRIVDFTCDDGINGRQNAPRGRDGHRVR